jgi:large subunit ribosomal protein L18
MEKRIDRKAARDKVRRRMRGKVRGTAERPRVAVFRTTKHIYAQAIDDASGRTLAQASTLDGEVRGGAAGGNVDAAKRVGAALGERLKAAGVEKVVFDRGGNRYHGRIKALADAAREAGVKF